jgi:hypothetical protein
VLEAWTSLPRRIYLDTCTLQAIHDYGGVIWEDEPFVPRGRAYATEQFEQEVRALQMIFFINQRAMFEFVVTESGLREVEGRSDQRYVQWVHDVRQTWLDQSEGEEVPPWGHRFYDRSFRNISKADRILLQDALDLRCHAFLTMERRLPTRALFIEQRTGLRVMRPTTHWGLLSPFVRLYS